MTRGGWLELAVLPPPELEVLGCEVVLEEQAARAVARSVTAAAASVLLPGSL
jgi:hypothetical protein